MLGSRSLKMSLPPFSIDVIGEAYLNGSKIMMISLQNLFCLDRRHGMMMIVRNVDLYRMLNTLVWQTLFKELVREKSFIGTCNFLSAIRHDQQNKEKVSRKVNSTCQATKKDKVKQVLARFNLENME
jgi:hypothetical protein